MTSVIIANRGEIALRVGRTAAAQGIRTTTIYTDPDRNSQHAKSSPHSINLGASSAYLDGERIIKAAKENGCQAIHPGYGFLSENAGFARRCQEEGIVFIGPPWEAIESMGSKSESKKIMEAAGVPCIPGYHGSDQNPEGLKGQAERIGFPVLLKAVKGGGGKGMRIVQTPEDFMSQLESAKTEARNSFGDDVMLVEKYITTPRHIEVQVFADKHGNCVALGERDCSVQRRHQKILEESPAPGLDDAVRQDLWHKARQAALAVCYQGAGTVEFIFDNDSGEFFFMEMNTRLQVEHPVTELVTGEDLVRWQFLIAGGGTIPLTQEEIEQRIKTRGHAIEARIYAEDPDMNFMPSTGTLTHLRTPSFTNSPDSIVRVDAGFVQGDEVSSHYDPMISKLIVRGPNRTAALHMLRQALEEYEVVGAITNIEFLKRLCVSPAFVAGDVETGYIQKHSKELYAHRPVPEEAFAQAAIGLLMQEGSHHRGSLLKPLGFGSSFQSRSFNLVETVPQGRPDPTPVLASIIQLSPNTFSITVNGNTFKSVTSTYDPSTKRLTSHFPHTRLSTTIVPSPSPTGSDSDSAYTLFHLGEAYRLRLVTPSWLEAALGKKEVANSVLAPMPCKVLRVEVAEGQDVVKDQPLVIIESMKMEMVVKSPGQGRVRRVVHRAGDICKQGTALVEFEDINDGTR